MTNPDETGEAVHHRTIVWELGYERPVCAVCTTPWPCLEAVKERCARLWVAPGLGCDCGWHDEKGGQDPEQEKVRWGV